MGTERLAQSNLPARERPAWPDGGPLQVIVLVALVVVLDVVFVSGTRLSRLTKNEIEQTNFIDFKNTRTMDLANIAFYMISPTPPNWAFSAEDTFLSLLLLGI